MLPMLLLLVTLIVMILDNGKNGELVVFNTIFYIFWFTTDVYSNWKNKLNNERDFN